ncbi:hypothetical protein ES703_62206 [subsurface metagenome]
MKDELKAFEAYVKELEALKKYDEVKRLRQEVSELKASLSEVQGERDKLKQELLVNMKAKEEACRLREALSRAEEELSMLKEAKVFLKGGDLTLEEAAHEFLKGREAEIKAKVERESEGLRKNFEAGVPGLVYRKLLAILKKSDLPAEIAQVIEEKVEEKMQNRLDDEFEHRVNEKALGRLQELKWTEWLPFIEAEVSSLGSSLKTLVAELQGTWQLTCDRCQSRVTVEIGPRQIAALLKGAQVAECPRCRDFNLPPAPAITLHKIHGSALEDLLEAYLADKGPPGKNEMERT